VQICTEFKHEQYGDNSIDHRRFIGFRKGDLEIISKQGLECNSNHAVPRKGGRAQRNLVVLPLDVTDSKSIASAVSKGVKKFGSIDVLVNNAGYGLMGVFESVAEEQVQRQYPVNVFGTMNVTKAVLPIMRKNRAGVIINISTFGGITAGQYSSLYNSSKFAVEGFSEALSHELAFLNIAVKLIKPGSVATNFRNGIEMIKNEIDDYNPQLATFDKSNARRINHSSS